MGAFGGPPSASAFATGDHLRLGSHFVIEARNGGLDEDGLLHWRRLYRLSVVGDSAADSRRSSEMPVRWRHPPSGRGWGGGREGWVASSTRPEGPPRRISDLA